MSGIIDDVIKSFSCFNLPEGLDLASIWRYSTDNEGLPPTAWRTIAVSSSFLRVKVPEGYSLSLRESNFPQFTDLSSFSSPNHSFPIPDITQIGAHAYTLSPRVADCLLSQCRNTEEGFFGRAGVRNPNVLAQRVFAEEIKKNDLLLGECDPGYVGFYRAPVLRLINPRQLKKEEELSIINKSVDKALAYISSIEDGNVCTFNLIRGLIICVNSLIFLNRDLDWEKYLECSNAFYNALNNRRESMRRGVQDLKSFFEGALKDGPLPESLVHLTPIQQKGLLLTVFAAGLDVSESPFQFLLEELAADPERQEEFYAKEEEERDLCAEALFKEAVGLKSRNLIARTTNRDLEFVIKDQKGCIVWCYFVCEGSSLEVVNSYANSHLTLFENPDVFNPHNRCPKTGNALIFGGGCHRCPGKDLVVLVVGKFLSKLIKSYKVIAPKEGASSSEITLQKRIL